MLLSDRKIPTNSFFLVIVKKYKMYGRAVTHKTNFHIYKNCTLLFTVTLTGFVRWPCCQIVIKQGHVTCVDFILPKFWQLSKKKSSICFIKATCSVEELGTGACSSKRPHWRNLKTPIWIIWRSCWPTSSGGWLHLPLSSSTTFLLLFLQSNKKFNLHHRVND